MPSTKKQIEKRLKRKDSDGTVSAAELAVLREVSPPYISKLKKKDPSPIVYADEAKKRIKYAETAANLDASGDIDLVNRPTRVTHNEATEGIATDASADLPATISGEQATNFDEMETGDLARVVMIARARKEHYQSIKEETEVRFRAGELIERDQVRAAAYKISLALKNSLEVLPNRLANQLADESDPFKIFQLLSDEIRVALDSVTDEIAKNEYD